VATQGGCQWPNQAIPETDIQGGGVQAAEHPYLELQIWRVEKGQAGARYHAVGEEGVALRNIAEVIGAGLKMPVESITPEEAPEYFGWMVQLVTLDLAASSAPTRQQLRWNPTGLDLLTDLRNMDYGVV
jgi:hypothetical protein